MAGATDDQNKRLAELKKEIPKRGMERHPSVLKCLSELPLELQSPAVTDLTAREAIQTIIAFPAQIQRGWEYVPKQALIFTPEGVVHLLSSIWPGQEPEITYVKGCGLMYVRVTLLLLYGCLEIVAQGQGSPTRIAMEFNTVAWNYLSRPLRQLLRATEPISDMSIGEIGYSPTIQQALGNLPLKFSNGVKIYGLLPGEKLDELVFQPASWKPWFLFFQRPVSANTLLLLTSHYMVVIQEELNVKQGWLLSYIPRSNISRVEHQLSDSCSELSVQLKQEEQLVDYKLILKTESAEAWRRQWVEHGGQWEDIPKQRD